LRYHVVFKNDELNNSVITNEVVKVTKRKRSNRIIYFNGDEFESRYYTEKELCELCKGLTVVVVRSIDIKGREMNGILIDVGAEEDYHTLLKKYTNVGMNCRVAVIKGSQNVLEIDTLEDLINVVGEQKFRSFVQQYLNESFFDKEMQTLGYQNK